MDGKLWTHHLQIFTRLYDTSRREYCYIYYVYFFWKCTDSWLIKINFDKKNITSTQLGGKINNHIKYYNKCPLLIRWSKQRGRPTYYCYNLRARPLGTMHIFLFVECSYIMVEEPWLRSGVSGTAKIHVTRNWTHAHHAATLSGMRQLRLMWTLNCFAVLCSLSAIMSWGAIHHQCISLS